MAKQNDGILGHFSGKLGPVTGGVWKGIPYLKVTPEESPDKKKRSAAQLANEAKMTFMNNALVPFHAFLDIGFEQLAIRKTALSAAYSYNYHQALMGEYPDFSIDYSLFKISVGPLPGLSSPSIALVEPNLISLRWAESLNTKVKFNDQVMLVLYSPELHMVQGSIGAAIRQDLQYDLTLADQLIGKNLEAYLAVTSFDRKKLSDSIYLGHIQP